MTAMRAVFCWASTSKTIIGNDSIGEDKAVLNVNYAYSLELHPMSETDVV